MDELFEIKSNDNSCVIRIINYGTHNLLVTISKGGLIAKAQVYKDMNTGLDTYFEDLANNWRGWNGTKKWTAFEGELEISASTDKTGHVTFDIELCEGMPAIWKVIIHFAVDAGTLEKLAEDARSFESEISN